MTSAEAGGSDRAAFVQVVLDALAQFQAHHERDLTPEERMSFIAGHAAGFSLGQKVEAVRHEQ